MLFCGRSKLRGALVKRRDQWLLHALAASSTFVIPHPGFAQAIPSRTTLNLKGLETDKVDALLGDLAEVKGLRSADRLQNQLTADPDALNSVLERLRRKRMLSGPDLNLLQERQVVDLRSLRNQVQQTVGPNTAGNVIEMKVKAELSACTDERCKALVMASYPDYSSLVAKLRGASGGCDAAASRYADAAGAIDSNTATQTDLLEFEAAARLVDNACMTAPWDAQAPAVARTGGGEAGQGALKATGLLQVDGLGDPFCGGVFLSPSEVQTALHCFGRADTYQALKQGRVTIRQADSATAPAWKVTAQTLDPSVTSGAGFDVSRDFLRLRLTLPATGVPKLTVRKPSGLEPAFVAGFMLGHDKLRKPAVSDTKWAATPEWWKGLRWAKPDGCVVVDSDDNCFRMLCETVRGFSGAPVFATKASPAEPLVLFGIVKGTEGGANVCRTPELAWSTIGVIRQ